MTDQLYYVAAIPFEAARQVGVLPSQHRSARLHGHSFTARVRMQAPVGWAPFPGGEVDALSAHLRKAIDPLDYAFVNEQIQVPTDENIGRWLRARLTVPGIESVGIQSTSDQGVDLDRGERAHIWRRFRFEAAHQLPNVPAGHQCGRMHGHGFEVILHVNQNIDGKSMGVDFDRLGECWAPIQAELHYACMNDIHGLENPTSEILSGWLWQRLKPELPNLSWVTTYETHTAGCHYDGHHYRIWKEQRFESALRLARAPQGDSRRRLHGHSYMVRLHLTAPLDAVLGWTVDYGDVKELFKPLYKQLDHHLLNELQSISDADVASVLHWLHERMASRLPQLDRIDLYETPGCGAVLTWGEQGPALPV